MPPLRKKAEPATLITATWRPNRPDDVMPAARPALGKRLTWIKQGPIREDGGPYDGQDAWLPVGLENFPGWVPSEDLADVERLG